MSDPELIEVSLHGSGPGGSVASPCKYLVEAFVDGAWVEQYRTQVGPGLAGVELRGTAMPLRVTLWSDGAEVPRADVEVKELADKVKAAVMEDLLYGAGGKPAAKELLPPATTEEDRDFVDPHPYGDFISEPCEEAQSDGDA